MKKIYSLLAVSMFVIAPTMAQQVENFTEVSCEEESRTLHDVLDSGKVVLVASSGFDCGICMNHAQDMVAIADTYEASLEVWAGKVNIYNQDDPTCENIDGWRNTFEWDNIFMFLDEDEHWFIGGTPVYYVIDPENKEVFYQGSSMPQVKAALQTLIGFGLSVDETNLQEEHFSLSMIENQIHANVHTNRAEEASFVLYDINGRLLFQENITLNSGENRLNMNLGKEFSKGIYLGVIKSETANFSTKLIY